MDVHQHAVYGIVERGRVESNQFRGTQGKSWIPQALTNIVQNLISKAHGKLHEICPALSVLPSFRHFSNKSCISRLPKTYKVGVHAAQRAVVERYMADVGRSPC